MGGFLAEIRSLEEEQYIELFIGKLPPGCWLGKYSKGIIMDIFAMAVDILTPIKYFYVSHCNVHH